MELKKTWQIDYRRPMTAEVRNRNGTKHARFEVRNDMVCSVVPKDFAAGGVGGAKR
jgi:hypothetical protein